MKKRWAGGVLLLLAAGSQALMAQTASATDFVRRTYIHGTPYAEAAKFTASDVPMLLAMLENPQEQKYWANVVATLGAIGDRSVIDPLIRFMTSGRAEKLDPSQYAAKTAVPMALGWAIYKSRDVRALTFLREGLNPAVWTRRLKWISPHDTNEAARNRQLVALSIIGLALSGHASALEAMVALRTRTGPDAPDKNLLAEALAAHEIIAREGLTQYYRAKLLNP